MKIWLRVAAAAGILSILAGCGRPSHGTVAADHWLRVADGQGDVPTLNPHLFSGATVHFIAALTMAYLFRYDANNALTPELATALPTKANGGVSPDGKTITFHLRHGVRWSDGAPFTAADVAFSIRTVLNRANNEVSRSGFDLIERTETLDPYTLRLHMKQPYAIFEPNFFGAGATSPCILPAHLLGKLASINDASYNALPVGIGPFRVTSWTPGKSVEMEANPFYWRGRPKLQRVSFLFIPNREKLLDAMQSYDVDLWPGAPPIYIEQIKAITALDHIILPGSYWTGVFFDLTRAPANDARVRRAIRLAIDPRQIVAEPLDGNALVTGGFLSPITPNAPADILPYELDRPRAAELLDRSGYRLGPNGMRTKDGHPLTLTLAYPSGISMNERIAQLIRGELSLSGIDLQTRQYPPARLFATYGEHGVLAHGDWDMALFAWDGGPSGSLESLFGCSMAPPNGQNIMHYCNPLLDETMHQFTMSFDPAQRHDLLEKIELLVQNDDPAFPLFVWNLAYTYAPELQGYTPSARAVFGDPLQLDI